MKMKTSIGMAVAGATLAFAAASVVPTRASAADSKNYEWRCEGHSGWYAYSLYFKDETCPGKQHGNACSVDCSKYQKRFEGLKKKIGQAYTPERGRKYTPREINAARRYLSTWGDEDVLKLIKELNGNLSDEAKKIFKGALKHWPLLKYHSDRLGIDPRIVFLVAVTESKFVQESGNSGEVGIMQIMPPTAEEMHRIYGRKDLVISKEGKGWRTKKDVMAVLALYYLRDKIREVGVESDSFPTEQQILEIYLKYNGGNKFYNNGEINLVKLQHWWQGDNFVNCTTHLRLYPKVEQFVNHFIAMHEAMEKKKLQGSVVPSAAEARKLNDEAKILEDHAKSVARFEGSKSSAAVQVANLPTQPKTKPADQKTPIAKPEPKPVKNEENVKNNIKKSLPEQPLIETVMKGKEQPKNMPKESKLPTVAVDGDKDPKAMQMPRKPADANVKTVETQEEGKPASASKPVVSDGKGSDISYALQNLKKESAKIRARLDELKRLMRK